MTRLLHLADVHLGASYSAFGGLASARSAAALEEFKKLPSIAASEAVEAVLIAGDLFDGPGIDNATIAAVRETLRRVAQSGRPVFIIPGNHDSVTLKRDIYRELVDGQKVIKINEETGSIVGRPDCVYVFTAPSFGAPVTVPLASGVLNVYGLAYDRSQDSTPLATFVRAPSEGLHIVLLHGPVPMASHWKASGNSLQLPIDALRRMHADYIALGDYHRPWLPAQFSTQGDIPACYPGSFTSLDLTETGDHGYAVVELTRGGKPVIAFRKTGLNAVHDIGDFDVGACDNEAAVASAIADVTPDGTIPVVRLVGSPAFPLDVEQVAAALEEQFECAGVEDATMYFASQRLAAIASQDTVAGHVVRLAGELIEATADQDEKVRIDGSLRVALQALGVS